MLLEVKQVKLEIYTPASYRDPLLEALTALGACRVGKYSHVAACQPAQGFWKPLAGSRPFHGKAGQLCSGEEIKMEVPCPVELVDQAVDCIRKIHPYEEPVIYIVPVLNRA